MLVDSNVTRRLRQIHIQFRRMALSANEEALQFPDGAELGVRKTLDFELRLRASRWPFHASMPEAWHMPSRLGTSCSIIRMLSRKHVRTPVFSPVTSPAFLRVLNNQKPYVAMKPLAINNAGVGSKKSVQQGHLLLGSARRATPLFCARSVLALRGHAKMARTLLAAFFNRPFLTNTANRWCSDLWHTSPLQVELTDTPTGP